MKPLKLSQFVVAIPYEKDFLLYNTSSRALLRMDAQGYHALRQNPNRLPETFMDTLKKQGFLVPAEVNEGQRYLDYLTRPTEQETEIMSVTLLVAYGCPLACGYCYQQGTHNNGLLKGAEVQKVIHFLKRQCEKRRVKEFFISFYGGEPLLNMKAITTVATEMQSYCRKRKIRFRFGMVTSGVLLTREIVEKLLPLGFVHAQVTIDGDEQTHDASRPFQSGKGTYNRIMENLEQYAGLIHTDILCVVNQSRIDAAYRLVNTLAAKGYAERRVRMTFSPESPTYDNETLSTPIDGAQFLWAEKEIAIAIAKLSVYAETHGLIDDLRPRSTWCAMQRHDGSNFVIGIDGKIYTCPTLVGRDEQYEAGHIDTGIGGIDTVLKEKYHRSDQCLECAYLPICADCRVDALYKEKDILAANSHEEKFDLIVPELVKGHYKATQRRKADVSDML